MTNAAQLRGFATVARGQPIRMDDNHEKPAVSESAREKAAEMAKAYEDRPTAVLPGSHNTVTGTAVNDWLDDDGNPKFGQGDDQPAGR